MTIVITISTVHDKIFNSLRTPKIQDDKKVENNMKITLSICLHSSTSIPSFTNLTELQNCL